MRKVIFGGANSLDNFIARKDDAVDWLLFSKDVQKIMKDMWKNIDTIVMGRKTYEVAQRMGGGGGGYPGVKTYVFSRTIKKPNNKKLNRLMMKDTEKLLNKLRNSRKIIPLSDFRSLKGRALN